MWPLSKIHQVGELIAAVAVVISLVFVGYEVQQNSQAQNRMATEAVVRDYVGTIRSVSGDAELACIYAAGVRDFESLSGSQRLRLSAFFLSTFYAIQEMHNLAQQGSIEPSIWRGFDELAREVHRLPGVRQWFKTRRHWFSEDFQRYVDENAQRSSPVGPLVYDDPACAKNN